MSDIGQLAGTLSGGNQQKVSVAKWLAANASILIIDEPTVGVDVRTKAAFHDLITELADKGLTIVLISSDLAEMVSLADRVCVMRAYRVIAEMDNSKRYDQMSVRIMAADPRCRRSRRRGRRRGGPARRGVSAGPEAGP